MFPIGTILVSGLPQAEDHQVCHSAKCQRYSVWADRRFHMCSSITRAFGIPNQLIASRVQDPWQPSIHGTELIDPLFDFVCYTGRYPRKVPAYSIDYYFAHVLSFQNIFLESLSKKAPGIHTLYNHSPKKKQMLSPPKTTPERSLREVQSHLPKVGFQPGAVPPNLDETLKSSRRGLLEENALFE